MKHKLASFDPELYLTLVGGYYLAEFKKSQVLGTPAGELHIIEYLLEMLEDSNVFNALEAVKWFNEADEESIVALDKNIQAYAENLHKSWLVVFELESFKDRFLRI